MFHSLISTLDTFEKTKALCCVKIVVGLGKARQAPMTRKESELWLTADTDVIGCEEAATSLIPLR
jgi:DNA-nicking Smr family endonuclease